MKKHIFSGHAQLPCGSDLYESSKFISVVMTVDMETGTILQSSVPLYCKIHNDFVTEIINGKSLEKDLNLIIKQIEKTVHTHTRRALVTAIQALAKRYMIEKNKYNKALK